MGFFKKTFHYSLLISFVIPPLPAGHYTGYLDVYDACDLSSSLSTLHYEKN